MNKKVKISEIIRAAIDKRLSDGSSENWSFETYSCCAIMDAVDDMIGNKYRYHMIERIDAGLIEMGLNPKSMTEFLEFPAGKKRQSARALWLEWVYMMAIEQGV